MIHPNRLFAFNPAVFLDSEASAAAAQDKKDDAKKDSTSKSSPPRRSATEVEHDEDASLEHLSDELEGVSLAHPRSSTSVHDIPAAQRESLLFHAPSAKAEPKVEVNSAEALDKWRMAIYKVGGNLSQLSPAWQRQVAEQGVRLKKLLLQDMPLTQELVKNIVQGFPKLREFSCSQLTDSALNELVPLKKLKSLTLYNCQNLTNPGLATLKALPRLEVLSLGQAKNITTGITHLASLVNLRTLVVLGSNPKKKEKRISDHHILQLQTLENLKVLKIGKCLLKKPEHTSIELVRKFKKLERLTLQDDGLVSADLVTSDGKPPARPPFFVIRLLQLHPTLSSFNGICALKYDDETFATFVADLDPNVTSLTITGMHNVTDKGLALLFEKKFPHLKEMELHGCHKLTPGVIYAMGDHLHHLRHVSLHGTYFAFSFSHPNKSFSIKAFKDEVPLHKFIKAVATHSCLLKSSEQEESGESKERPSVASAAPVVPKEEKKAKPLPTVEEVD
jgi:hypothetical protein